MDFYTPPNAPISLIQWHDRTKSQYAETWDALVSFAEEVPLAHSEVQRAEDVKRALAEWFQKSPGNAQYSYVGAHGLITQEGKCVGIGASLNPNEYAKWDEVWTWYTQGELLGGLWLGGCRTSDAATGMTPLLQTAERVSIPYIYGFSDPNVSPSKELKPILLKLIELTRTDDIEWLDDELAILRRTVSNTTVELYYPAFTKAGQRKYVNVNTIEDEVRSDLSTAIGESGTPGWEQSAARNRGYAERYPSNGKADRLGRIGMSNVGKKERVTQNRLLKLFREGLEYDYLGNWEERAGNGDVEEELLIKWLKRHGHDDKIIGKVLHELDKAKALGGSQESLRRQSRSVWLIALWGEGKARGW